MKSTKRVLALVLAMLMLFSAFSVLASAKSVDVAETGAAVVAGTDFYLKPNSNWTQASARFAIYFFGSGEAWVSMTYDSDAGAYKGTAPGSGYTGIIFCRMNPSTTANNWNNKWNQTSDLTWDGTNNTYTVKSGTWDKGGGTWSYYQAPTEAPVDPEVPTDPPTEAPTVVKTVYCIDSAKWGTVSAHAWVAADTTITTAWPGYPMTKTELKDKNGFDVYEYTFSVDYDSVIFNNNNNGKQTDDLTLEEGKYYDLKSGAWYATLDEVPEIDVLATDCYLLGTFNEWNALSHEFKLDEEGSSTGYISIDLEANTTYEFKVIREGAWTSNATTITGDTSGLTFSSSTSGNCKITTTIAGEYVFAYNKSTSQLAVTYPVEVTEPVTEEPTDAPTEPVATPDEPVVEPTEPEATEPEPTEPSVEDITVYFQNNWMWTNVSIYTWDPVTLEPVAAWPGIAMEKYGNDGTYDIYVAKVPAGNKIVINGVKDDGTNAIDQTPDIVDAVDGRCYYMKWVDGNQVGFEDIEVILPPVVPTEPEATEPEATEPEATPDEPATEAPTEPEEEPEYPEFVSGLTVVDVTETSIDITWDKVSGAQKYWVYVNGAVKYVTTDTAMTIKADSNTTCELAVTAKLADDTILTYANAEKVEATTLATVADEFAYEVTAAATVNSVTIDWTTNIDTKAWVYFGTSADELKIVGATTANTLTVNDLKSDTTYYYKTRYIVDGVAFESEVASIETVGINVEIKFEDDYLAIDWDDYEGATKYWLVADASGKEVILSSYESNVNLPMKFFTFNYEIRALVDGKVIVIY